MKKTFWVVVIIILALAIFFIRPNKGMDSVYSVLPSNVLMTFEVKDLNGEIDFINSLGFADGDILAPLFAESDEVERKVVELTLDVLGDKFIVAYKRGRLEEKISAEEEVVVQDLLDNLIMVSRPVKQISVSFIEKSLAGLIDDVVVSEYDGVTINTFEIDDSKEPVFISYCVVDGMIIGAFSLDTLSQSIDLAKDKNKDNFTQTELYLKLISGTKQEDVFSMSFDMSEFMTTYINAVDAVTTSQSTNIQTNGVVEFQQQMAALKDMYDGLGYGVGYMGRTDKEFYARSNGNFVPEKLNDFYKSIFIEEGSVSDMTKFHIKEPVIAYAANMGIQEYINLILETLPEDEITEMKSSFAEETDLNLDDIIECIDNGISLGIDEFEYTTMLPNFSVRMLVGLSSKHGQLMPSLNTLAAMSEMPMTKKNIAGTDVIYANIPMTILKPGFAIKDNKMLFATSLDVMLELIQGVKLEESLGSNLDFIYFLGDEDLFGWYYLDINKIIDVLDNMYMMFKPFMAGKVPEEIMSEDKVENNLAKAKMFRKIYMKAYTKGDEYYSEMVIKYDKDYEPLVEEVEVIGIQK